MYRFFKHKIFDYRTEYIVSHRERGGEGKAKYWEYGKEDKHAGLEDVPYQKIT